MDKTILSFAAALLAASLIQGCAGVAPISPSSVDDSTELEDAALSDAIPAEAIDAGGMADASLLTLAPNQPMTLLLPAGILALGVTVVASEVDASGASGAPGTWSFATAGGLGPPCAGRDEPIPDSTTLCIPPNSSAITFTCTIPCTITWNH